MKIYVAGPITGKPNFNREAFKAAEIMLRSWDDVTKVFNPCEAEHSVRVREAVALSAGELSEEDRRQFTRDCLSVDLDWIAKEADAIYFLKDWEHSPGARAEHALATALRLEFFYESGDELNFVVPE